MATQSAPLRTACHGSCHCGFTKYIIFLDLPHPFGSSNPPKRGDQEVYRCNCNACHKMNFFHVHPAHPRNDFMLLSPLEPDIQLSTYRCYTMKLKYYFCPRCGVRCLTFYGESEITKVDLPELGGKREVWQAKWDGQLETEPYIAVNGVTIDPGQIDLRVLTEEKRVQYFDDLSEPEEKKKAPRWERPHYSGCY